jgi:hypothetical protein
MDQIREVAHQQEVEVVQEVQDNLEMEVVVLVFAYLHF